MDLRYLTELQIDYISDLDYVDILNLSMVNKYFTSLTTNNILLRATLNNKNEDIIISANFDIGAALNSLFQIVKTYISITNKPFEDHIKRLIYREIYQNLGNHILVYWYINNEDQQNISHDYKSEIEIESTLFEINYPKIFIDYINPSISKLMETYERKSLECFAHLTFLLRDLLFV